MTGANTPGYSDPLPALTALLSKSWRIGRLFGIEIRVYCTVVVVYLFTVWGVTHLPSVLVVPGLLVGLLFLTGLYVVILVHEFGHAFAGRRFGMRTPTITLSPFGGLAHMLDAPPSPKAEILVSLAGPLTHGLWIAAAWLLKPVVPPIRFGEWGFEIDTMAWLLELNVWLAIFNLLPCFPMDGGRVLRGLLALRSHPNRATMWVARIGAVGAIGFMAWGMTNGGLGGSLLFMIGLNNLLACGRELTMVRYSEGPYRQVGAAWELDPEGWKDGASEDRDERPARLGWLQRWRMNRRVRLLEREADDRTYESPPVPRATPRSPTRERSRADDERGDESELDRLLDRVRDVGMSGLTDDERDRLRSISQARHPR